LDSLTLRKMIGYAETAIRWATEVGSDWAGHEQAANYELFGELGGLRNRIYHHYYRDFRVDVLVATVGDELPGKVVRWKAKLAEIEAAESLRDA
jgi:hypothetical protein